MEYPVISETEEDVVTCDVCAPTGNGNSALLVQSRGSQSRDGSDRVVMLSEAEIGERETTGEPRTSRSVVIGPNPEVGILTGGSKVLEARAMIEDRIRAAAASVRSARRLSSRVRLQPVRANTYIQARRV